MFTKSAVYLVPVDSEDLGTCKCMQYISETQRCYSFETNYLQAEKLYSRTETCKPLSVPPSS
jgi:hypothetical protein